MYSPCKKAFNYADFDKNFAENLLVEGTRKLLFYSERLLDAKITSIFRISQLHPSGFNFEEIYV